MAWELMNKSKFLILAISAVFVVGFSTGINFSASADENPIPVWIKNIASYWSTDQVTDQEFLNAIQFLIENEILIISTEENPPSSDTDTDFDGVPNLQDACPNQPETYNGYMDSDGCPDTFIRDSDGDGISDEFDVCPNQPETFNGFEDEDGCPDSVK